MLPEQLDLTGAKIGCGEGSCGAVRCSWTVRPSRDGRYRLHAVRYGNLWQLHDADHSVPAPQIAAATRLFLRDLAAIRLGGMCLRLMPLMTDSVLRVD